MDSSRGVGGVDFIITHPYALPPMGFSSHSASMKAVKKLRNPQRTCLTHGLHPTRLPSACSDTYLTRSQRCAGELVLTSPGDYRDARIAALPQIFYDTVVLGNVLADPPGPWYDGFLPWPQWPITRLSRRVSTGRSSAWIQPVADQEHATVRGRFAAIRDWVSASVSFRYRRMSLLDPELPLKHANVKGRSCLGL